MALLNKTNSALVEYGSVLRARWRWITWGVLLALFAVTAFLIFDPPLYQTKATVFVRTPGDVSTVLDGGDSYAQGRAKTYAALANNTSLSARIAADLGLDVKPEVISERIRATNTPGTALINFTVSAPSGAEAQRMATVLLDEYSMTVQELEAVPGSLVPRAEFVVVTPPTAPVRVMAWGVPVPIVLLGAALVGLVLGAAAAVLRSIFEHPPILDSPGVVGTEKDDGEVTAALATSPAEHVADQPADESRTMVPAISEVTKPKANETPK